MSETTTYKNLPGQIVLASGNAGKLREIADILALPNVVLRAQGELGIESPEETGQTFVENALLKACFAAAESGLPAIGDDSGLSVDALHGRPGVRSARYAGERATDEENVSLLLEEMASVPDGQRYAGFHCAAVLVFPQQVQKLPLENIEPIVTEGIWRGEITRSRSGAGGFGYDPVFQDVGTAKTGAQMSRAEKGAVSHRGKAFRELRKQLLARYS